MTGATGQRFCAKVFLLCLFSVPNVVQTKGLIEGKVGSNLTNLLFLCLSDAFVGCR